MIEILPLIMLLGVPGLMVLLLVRDRVAARRAGISNERPVCAKCRYRLGGWPPPVCPECGADVTVTGVRIRPQSARWWLSAVFSFITILLVGYVVSGLLYYRSMDYHGGARARYASTDVAGFHVTLSTDYETHAVSRTLLRHETSVILRRIPPDAIGRWSEGEYTGAEPTAIRQLDFDQDGGPPDRATIREAVRAVIGADADDVQVEQHVNEIANQVDELLVTMHRDVVVDERDLASLASDLLELRGSSDGGHSSSGWQVMIITPVVVLLTVGLVLVAIAYGSRREGLRPVRDGEWGVRTE